jgi:hypothetical protein
VPPDPANPGAAWAPDFLDFQALCHELQVSDRQARRLLSAGRVPPADVNLTDTLKGRRWTRQKLVEWIAAGRRGGGT